MSEKARAEEEDDPCRAAASPYHADAQVLERILDLLPAMSTGYEPGLRRDLLHALACFAALAPDVRARVPEWLTGMGWNAEDVDEAGAALGRVLTDPCTPEEWIVHDAYVIENGHGRCVTPWGVHLQEHPDSSSPPMRVGPSMARLTMLDAILDRLSTVLRDHPLRVAVDGGTAAGKTTLAEELARRHVERSGTAIRASFDFFKIPPERRPKSPRPFGGHVFDATALIEELLRPLGPTGSRRYRTATYDGWMSRSLRERPARTAPDHAMAFVDGAFLWTPQLRAWWDYWVFVEVDVDVAIERYVVRDALWTPDPDPERMRARFRERYLPAESAYARTADPWRNADVVLRNDDPDQPHHTFASTPVSSGIANSSIYS